MTGTLHLVAVPIGNLDDLGTRARDTLAAAALVAVEDTRHFATLSRHHGLRVRTVSYHDHNEAARTTELLGRLRSGEDVALVTDAGTPLVSDPGFRLVRAAIDAGIAVTAIPGPSAVVTGARRLGPAAPSIPLHRIPAAGGGPRRSALERIAGLEQRWWCSRRRTVSWRPLRDALAVLGDRPACLARNLTKPHERYQRGTLSELLGALEAEGEVRGEATLVIGGSPPTPAINAAEADASLLLEHGAPARAVQELVQRRHGLSKRDAYALMLRLRDR